ncbi:MAG: hypothetical protein HOE90_19590 [Bacteriovoracaceae bacterium]|jgi:hypothetical protein|nr:hypothetical protein [Bacteriovoracaceae bacterium]
MFKLVFLLSTLTAQAFGSFNVVHYNIKELSTLKLLEKSEQVEMAVKVLNKQYFDILSINEIQYDLPGVPLKELKTRGQNMKLLGSYLGLDWSDAFGPANTGMDAKKGVDGNYYFDPYDSNARKNADFVSYGLFPAQYSTGGLFKFKVKEVKIFQNLKWIDFNPSLDLTPYKDISGADFPKDMKLFDKNFTDATLEIEGRDVHVIFFHTVPAYHFGNKLTPNYIRNEDQLKFLEWYLTGSTDLKVGELEIKPLQKDDIFIAMGDWNTDIKNAENPGSLVLNSLFKKVSLWMETPAVTYVGQSLHHETINLTLDYIVFRGLKLVKGGVYRPESGLKTIKCTSGKIEEEVEIEEDLVFFTYSKSKDEKCRAQVFRDYYQLKNASDHLPLWAEFDFL